MATGQEAGSCRPVSRHGGRRHPAAMPGKAGSPGSSKAKRSRPRPKKSSLPSDHAAERPCEPAGLSGSDDRPAPAGRIGHKRAKEGRRRSHPGPMTGDTPALVAEKPVQAVRDAGLSDTPRPRPASAASNLAMRGWAGCRASARNARFPELSEVRGRQPGRLPLGAGVEVPFS
jgi:hypothetical protein